MSEGEEEMQIRIRLISPVVLLGLVFVSTWTPSVALADSEKTPPPQIGQTSSGSGGFLSGIGIRGFVHGGIISLTASRSFEALTGEPTGDVFGGGAQVTLGNGVFFQFNVEQFKKTGNRAFIHEGQVFSLGISDTVTVTPITFGGGYRFTGLGRVVPYGGGGYGSYGYREESDFAESGEDVEERFGGYHVMGGAEFTFWASDTLALGVAAEIEYSSVPDALGEGGISKEFAEDDLGGTTFRVKFLVGRW